MWEEIEIALGLDLSRVCYTLAPQSLSRSKGYTHQKATYRILFPNAMNGFHEDQEGSLKSIFAILWMAKEPP
jgi:hypothetical protein